MKKTMSTLALMLAVTLPLCLFTACSDDDDTDNGTKGSSKAGTINGHEYVDLGLSVKWATCNVGASTPSDYGDYFAWGETETKEKYNEGDCITLMDNICGDSQYDAATANWYKPWRLPTQEEIRELVAECEWTWTTQDGHKGYEVTSTNGNSIFLPASGERIASSLHDKNSHGHYWSGSPDLNDKYDAYVLSICESEYGAELRSRHFGWSVRPVSE